MKFLLSIFLLVSVFGAQYNFFGVTKSAATILREFADSVTYILNTTGYIQCYDVTKVVKIFFTSPTVTLSNIEVMGIKVTSPLAASQLVYSANNDKASIVLNSTSTSFGLKAKISLKWTYTVLNWMIYRGGYTADLDAVSPTILFSFLNNSPTSTGKIGFSWKLSNAQVSGFGAVDMVKTVIGDMFNQLLAPVLNDELNRYNDIIVSSFIYNYFYRSIPIPSYAINKEPTFLKNVFSKFILINKNSSNFLSFAYNSSIYYAIEHTEVPIIVPFTPNDDLNKPISIYIGVDGFKQIPNQVHAKGISNYTWTSDNLTKVFGYPVNIGVLSRYIPKLAEDYSSTEKLGLRFAWKSNKKGSYSSDWKFVFYLERDPKTIVLDIENLSWCSTSKIDMKPEDNTNKTVNFKLSGFNFQNIAVKSPKMPKYQQMQLQNLLQPISRFNLEWAYPLKVVGDNMNWVFSGIDNSGDATLYYTPK